MIVDSEDAKISMPDQGQQSAVNISDKREQPEITDIEM